MARMSTGKNSKQDYRTPKQLVEAIEKRFGKISVDVAADFSNKVCEYYYCAPDSETTIDSFGCVGKDSLAQDWAHHQQLHYPGLFFDNCPFNSIPEFSNKHREEMIRGCESVLLIPDDATKAYIQNVCAQADIYRLVGRVPFKVDLKTGKKEVFPKDCCVAHFKPCNDRPKYVFWDWKNDRILHSFIIE